MSIQTSYSDARARLAELCRKATEDRETIIIRRRNGEDVALIAADELSSLEETAYLLRSPRNAERLLRALQRSLAGTEPPMSIEQLRKEVGLDQAE